MEVLLDVQAADIKEERSFDRDFELFASGSTIGGFPWFERGLVDRERDDVSPLGRFVE